MEKSVNLSSEAHWPLLTNPNFQDLENPQETRTKLTLKVQFLTLLNRDFYPAEEPHFEASGPSGTKDLLSPDATLVDCPLDLGVLQPAQIQPRSSIENSLKQNYLSLYQHQAMQPPTRTSVLFFEELKNQTPLSEGASKKIISLDSKADVFSLLYSFGHGLNGDPFLQTAPFILPGNWGGGGGGPANQQLGGTDRWH